MESQRHSSDSWQAWTQSIMSSPPGENQYIISPRLRRIINYLGSLFSEGECGSPGNGCAGDLYKDRKLALQVNNILLKCCEGLYRHSNLGHLPCTCSCPTNTNRALAKSFLPALRPSSHLPDLHPLISWMAPFRVLTTPPKEQVLIPTLNKYFLCPLRSNLNHSSLLQISCQLIPGKE